MATIGNADVETINELLKERGMKPTYIRVDKLKLIEAVNCDLIITGVSPMVNETTPISEVKKIPKPEFAIKCRENDTIGDLKKLIAAQTGTRHDKIVLKKWYTIYKDHITLEDYEIRDGMNLELYYQ